MRPRLRRPPPWIPAAAAAAVAAALALGAGAVPGAAAGLRVDGGAVQVLTVRTQPSDFTVTLSSSPAGADDHADPPRVPGPGGRPPHWVPFTRSPPVKKPSPSQRRLSSPPVHSSPASDPSPTGGASPTATPSPASGRTSGNSWQGQ